MLAASSVEKFNALEGATEYVVPLDWNAGHVAYRMINAFQVLRSLPGRVGPQMYGSSWPVMLQEFEDLVDEQAMANARLEFMKSRPRWSADEIERADEALAWPVRYLADYPMRADALGVWAMGKAAGLSVSRLLRGRAQRAAQAAQRAQDKENARRAELRRSLASDTVAWANAELAQATDDIERRAIRHEAAIRYNRLVLTTPNLHDVVIRPSEVLAHKVLSRASLDRYLPAALNTLAQRLTEADVPVR